MPDCNLLGSWSGRLLSHLLVQLVLSSFCCADGCANVRKSNPLSAVYACITIATSACLQSRERACEFFQNRHTDSDAARVRFRPATAVRKTPVWWSIFPFYSTCCFQKICLPAAAQHLAQLRLAVAEQLNSVEQHQTLLWHFCWRCCRKDAGL